MPTAGQNSVVSTLSWLGSLILLSIPLVGLILCLIWAFGRKANYNRRNLARASLIFMVACIVLGLVFSTVFATIFQSVISSFM